MDANGFEDGADAAAGDNTSTLGSRFEQDDRTAHLANGEMGNGGAGKVDLVHILVGFIGSFSHRVWNSIGFTNAHSDFTVVITHDECHPELETTAAFNNLGDTGNLDYTLVKSFCLLFDLWNLVIQHNILHQALELQAALAGAFGQSLDPTGIFIAAAVEYDHLYTFALGPFRQHLADQLGLFGFLQAFHLAA